MKGQFLTLSPSLVAVVFRKKMEEDEEIVDALTTHKSAAWTYFGFPARSKDNGEKIVARTHPVCTAASATSTMYQRKVTVPA